VVTQDELRRFGGVTLLQVLERVAGLNVASSNFGDSSLIAVRGDRAPAMRRRGTPVSDAEERAPEGYTAYRVPYARRSDLVFFSTNGTGTVSHVGIYLGGDTFIHAPKHGRKISREKLTGYYREHLLGARTYL